MGELDKYIRGLNNEDIVNSVQFSKDTKFSLKTNSIIKRTFTKGEQKFVDQDIQKYFQIMTEQLVSNFRLMKFFQID